MGTCESQPHCYFVPNITSMMGPLLPSYVSLLNALNTQLLREHVLNTHQQYMFVHMLIIILQHSRSHHERRTNCQGYPHVSMYCTLFASIIFVSPHCNHALTIIHQNEKKSMKRSPGFYIISLTCCLNAFTVGRLTYSWVQTQSPPSLQTNHL